MQLEMNSVFVINELLSVRFNSETGKTEVFVSDEPFHQCKHLLLINPKKSIYEKINSIDEAAELMSHALEKELMPEELGITPLEEFQAHCSNLQAWAEHGYDNRLLHTNLAFPLLEKLATKGDNLAQARFNSQVAVRFAEGTRATRQFILEQGYLQLLTDEEKLTLYNDILCERDANVLEHLYKDREGSVPIYSYDERRFFTEKSGNIRSLVFELGDEYHLYLSNYNYKQVLEAIFSLKDLRSLTLSSNYFTVLPDRFGELKHLEKLEITECKMVPESIGELKRLKNLSIGRCKRSIPQSIGKLKQLRTLIISDNQDLTSLPESIGNLTQLEELTIRKNPQLTRLPKSLKNLENLRTLEINGKNIENIELPEHCPHLTKLTLSGVSLGEIPSQVWNYRSLRILAINGTQICEIPENIITLENLSTIWLDNNMLKSLPAVLETLSLEAISIKNNPLMNFPAFLLKIRTLSTIYSDEEQVKLLGGSDLLGFKITEDFNISRL